jgi:hypothetical protein
MLGLLSAALVALSIAQAGDCPIAIESREDAVLLRPACPTDRRRTQEAVAAILAKAEANKVQVSFGRIERYQWLSEQLARQASASRHWQPGIGKDNAYVAGALRGMPEFTALFGA